MTRFIAALLVLVTQQAVAASAILPPWQRSVHAADQGGEVMKSDVLPPWQRGRSSVAASDVQQPVAVAVPAAPAASKAQPQASVKCVTVLKSAHAVGAPCETTRSFMTSLGLSDQQIQAVESIQISAH